MLWQKRETGLILSLMKVYREVEGKIIPEAKFQVIVNNFNYYLVTITVYADGMIDCWGLVSFNTFKEYLATDWVVLDLPPDTDLHIEGLGQVEIKVFIPEKTTEDFLKEIEDCIVYLNGGKDRCDLCIDQFKEYLVNPSQNNLQKLKVLYDDVPSHKKVMFEIARQKDQLIKLMEENTYFTKEERQYILSDYYDENWNLNDLK